jgi:hypothetical protein
MSKRMNREHERKATDRSTRSYDPAKLVGLRPARSLPRRSSVLMICCLLWALGCQDDAMSVPDESQEVPVDPSSVESLLSVSLEAMEDCDSVARFIKESTIADMEERLAANLETALIQPVWGEPERDFPIFRLPVLTPVVRVSPSVPSSTTGATFAMQLDSASEYSTTNNQVSGVDEADFIKNDGQYIYILADGALQIIDSWPPETAERMASYPVEGLARKLFIWGDRALVYSSLDAVDPMDSRASSLADTYDECTYGFDCEFQGDGLAMKVTLLDLSDRNDPQLIRETYLRASFINARRIGNIVHTVASYPDLWLPELLYWPDGISPYRGFGDIRALTGDIIDSPDEEPSEDESARLDRIRALFAELAANNRELIESAAIEDLVPDFDDTVYANDSSREMRSPFGSCNGFLVPDVRDGRAMLSVLSVDLDAEDDMSATTIIGRPGAVYSTAESLYVAVNHSYSGRGRWFFPSPDSLTQSVTVHQFKLGDEEASSRYKASGLVDGRILNQFSMDEYDGSLRMATTLQSSRDNSLTVLHRTGHELEVIGEVTGLGPDETIRSVRFDGDVAFIVTFKKTDPLFVLDLSVADSPRLRGELKIPGFSTYMHMLDEDHLLTIGYDGDDRGTFAWFQGVQLQIIDVTDLDDPILLHREIIGSRGTSSEAAMNHLAFNFQAEQGVLAVPMTLCEGSSGGSQFGPYLTFSGLLVYDIDIDMGIEEIGGISHVEAESAYDPQSPALSCSNWWTNANSEVKRSIFMSGDVGEGSEDFVYSVALDKILIASLDDLENPVRRIDLDLSPATP